MQKMASWGNISDSGFCKYIFQGDYPEDDDSKAQDSLSLNYSSEIGSRRSIIRLAYVRILLLIAVPGDYE